MHNKILKNRITPAPQSQKDAAAADLSPHNEPVENSLTKPLTRTV